MDELKEASSKFFGRDLSGDCQKYFYYDSEEDRIDISDDEDLESAVDNCSKNTLKIFVENYNISKDPFFRSNTSSQKADLKTGASSDRSQLNNSKFSKVFTSTRSIEESIEPEEDADDEFPLNIPSIKETVSVSEDSEEEEKAGVGESTNSQPENQVELSFEESKVSQRKNTEIVEHIDEAKLDMLDERECKVTPKSLPRGYSISNSKDPRHQDTWAPSLSKELQDQLNSEEFKELKKEWQFQVKAEKCFDKEYDRKRYSGLDKVYAKLRVASGHPEERAKLAIVEDSEPNMGNSDVILCKKGSLVSKSWIVKNVGCTIWPKNSRLVCESKIGGLVLPMILDRLKPGDKMILTINYQVPIDFDLGNDVFSFNLSLNSKGFGNFGEKLVFSYHVDDELFELKSQMQANKKLQERVKFG